MDRRFGGLDGQLADNGRYIPRQASANCAQQWWQTGTGLGEMGNAGQVPYVSSKAGLIGLTKAMAKELAPRNITVNAVTPGFIDTEMTAALTEELKTEYQKVIPLNRFGKPGEVAALVRFLASDEAAYITGQIVGINGGMYM